jgi:hypothetical protein
MMPLTAQTDDSLDDLMPFVPNLANTAGSSASPALNPITVVNAGTTYGLDTSVENNYGLGAGFMSTTAMATQQVAQTAAPSPLWLLAFVLIAWWLL